MDIKRNDIVDYINGYNVDEQNIETLKKELYELYSVDGDKNKEYVIDLNVESIVKENITNQKVYNERKQKMEKDSIILVSQQKIEY